MTSAETESLGLNLPSSSPPFNPFSSLNHLIASSTSVRTMTCSPSQHRHDTFHTPARKRRRTQPLADSFEGSSFSSSSSIGLLADDTLSELSEDEDNTFTHLLDLDLSIASASNNCSAGTPLENEDIEFETQANRLKLQQEMRKKNSKNNYPRHFKAYARWIEEEDQRRNLLNPARTDKLTAEPITIAKVALFLKFESTRPKARGGTGTVGAESISQTISALESHRFDNQHLTSYKADPDSQKPLRSDARITTFETAAKRNEPLRALNAEKMKNAGPSSTTYTPAQLKKIAMSAMEGHRTTPASVAKGLRDRAMILLSCAMAFRGDSLRALLLSDLGIEDLAMPEIAAGATILTAVRDNAKHNKEGRVEQHATLRHLYPEMCGIGALAFYFFAEYHVLGKPKPNFAPDFTDSEFPEFGRRDWWRHVLFCGSRGELYQMSYANQRLRTNGLLALNGVHVSSKTHGGRHYNPKTAGDNRASLEGRKALGKWKEGRGAFENAYDHQHPIDAMLGVAMFDAKRPESYTCARNCLEPPLALLSQLFPWVEDELRALSGRCEQFGKRGEDYALRQFLTLLLYLRQVLLQDAALLFAQYPECAVFNYPPFNSDIFRTWARESTAIVQAAEARSREQFENLPEHLVSSLRGILMTQQLESERRYERLRAELLASQPPPPTQSEPSKSRKRKRTKAVKVSTPSLSPLMLTTNLMDDIVTESASSTATTPITTSSISLSSVTFSSSTLTTPLLALDTSVPASDSNSPASPTVSSAYLNPGVTFPSSASVQAEPNTAESQVKAEAMKVLVLRFGAEKVAKHEPWTWVASTNSRTPSEYLPTYTFMTPSSLREYWDEWTVGLDGHLSIRELNEGWDARWRRNQSRLKTENSRYNKVRELIETLQRRRNWSMDLVWRFLDTRFAIPTKGISHLATTRSFIEYLQKKGGTGMKDVLSAADTYP